MYWISGFEGMLEKLCINFSDFEVKTIWIKRTVVSKLKRVIAEKRKFKQFEDSLELKRGRVMVKL